MPYTPYSYTYAGAAGSTMRESRSAQTGKVTLEVSDGAGRVVCARGGLPADWGQKYSGLRDTVASYGINLASKTPCDK